ncbi:type IV pilin protein [Luteimonas salinilitoris]|uniref:Type IV pilin protein n=1 Tax=Luteimonas salinilitoris TaxID=3237697 RepID=A0ABV4HQB1_9GAMM
MELASTATGKRSSRRSPRRPRGFTLIELMVVVAIVAILAAIAYPSYQEQVRKSRRGQVKVDLVELAQRAERFHSVNNTYEGFEASLATGDLESPRGGGTVFYTLAITEEEAAEFEIAATPASGSPQAIDRCGVLTINSAGVRTHSKGNDDECQFGSTP